MQAIYIYISTHVQYNYLEPPNTQKRRKSIQIIEGSWRVQVSSYGPKCYLERYLTP